MDYKSIKSESVMFKGKRGKWYHGRFYSENGPVLSDKKDDFSKPEEEYFDKKDKKKKEKGDNLLKDYLAKNPNQ